MKTSNAIIEEPTRLITPNKPRRGKASNVIRGPWEKSLNDLRMIKHLTENSLYDYTRYHFKEREGVKFVSNVHHYLISQVLKKVVNGEITRLIINIPPGFSKTEQSVMMFISQQLAINARCKFMHLSYGDDLALDNSQKTRDIVESEAYQRLWPVKIRSDVSAKKKWYTQEGGGVYATSAGGQVTGFRAGRMEPGFQGALIIDDPIKPDDAYSDGVRTKINNRFMNTFKSRLALESTPMILIMQRIHEDDPSAFLLRGGSGEKWHHLELPAEIDAEYEAYPEEYEFGVPIRFSGKYLPRGPLWEYKMNQQSIDNFKVGDPYTWAAQYQQRPTSLSGGIFKSEWLKQRFVKYDRKENLIWVRVPGSDQFKKVRALYKVIYGDTAMKTGERNDYSVFQCWLKGSDGNIYMLDQVRGKWEATDLRYNFLQFCDKHSYVQGVVNMGVRYRRVEDKASGTGLIQDINRERGADFVQGIQRNKDKVSRAMGVVPHFAQGHVYYPENADWLSEYFTEIKKFTAAMTHKHDDQVDPTVDAVEEMLIGDLSSLYDNVT